MSENFDDGEHVIIDNDNENENENENENLSDDHDSLLEGGSKISGSDDSDDSDEGSDIEYEEIDLTDNPLYQVLSTLFEDEEGNNLCTILKSLVKSVNDNTHVLNKLLKKKKN